MLNRSKLAALLVLLGIWPVLAYGQQEMRSATKGSSTPLPITGTVIDANHNGLDVNVVGGSVGGGTQYAEDSAHVSGDSVNMAGVVQQSADAALSSDGDRSVLQVDSNGYLKVNIKAGAGSGGTAMTDDAAFTPGTTSITPMGAMFDDVAPDSVNEGDGGVPRMSANRNLYTTIRDAAGNERGLNVDANGEVGIGSIRTSITPGTSAAHLGKAEDAAHASGDTGLLMLGVRNDSLATTLTSTDGDYSPFALDNLGRLFITQTSIIPGTNATHLGKAEDAAHTTGDTLIGVATKRTDTAASSAGTDGDYATLNTDATGRLWSNTELPDAATLADDTSNPTVPGVASFNMCYDGTNWDRCTKATAGQGAVDSATQRVTVAQGATACPNYIAISQTADTTLVSGTSSQYFYICSIILVAGAAEVVSLWEGTGTACGTGSTAILGSTTEANGLSVSANGGFSAVSGIPFLRTATTANDLCLRQSGANRVSGVITYYKAP